MDHINLVKLYDIVSSKNNIYIIMEYCDGGTLDKYIKSKPQRRLTESEALMYFK